MTVLRFFVPGFPATQGGMKPVPIKGSQFHRLITTGSAGLEQWRKKVTATAQTAMQATRATTIDGPVALSLGFFLPMPPSRPAADRRRGIAVSVTKPDMDKLVRAIQDSLSLARAYTDDNRVAGLTTTKYEVVDHTLCGVVITVQPFTEDEEVWLQALARRIAVPGRLSRLDVAVRTEQRAKARSPRQ